VILSCFGGDWPTQPNRLGIGKDAASIGRQCDAAAAAAAASDVIANERPASSASYSD